MKFCFKPKNIIYLFSKKLFDWTFNSISLWDKQQQQDACLARCFLFLHNFFLILKTLKINFQWATLEDHRI